jgi:uncharacterized protein
VGQPAFSLLFLCFPWKSRIIIILDPMISQALIDAILAEYVLPLDGVHGLSHWARVLENGRRLAAEVGAKVSVVELFAVLHDARRINEGRDDGHGLRAAELARFLGKSHFHLPDFELKLLLTACEDHTDGRTDGDITVQTCWDADRLDLYRVGIRPQTDYLCTKAAKTPRIIRWAMGRSTQAESPARIAQAWGIALPSR